MDVVVVLLPDRARPGGSPASGAASASSSSTRSTPSACAARRSRAQRRGRRRSTEPRVFHDYCFYGPNGALTPTGDLVLEIARLARAGCSPRAPRRRGRSTRRSCSAPRTRIRGYFVPGRHGRRAAAWRSTSCWSRWTASTTRRSCSKIFTNRLNTFLDAIYIVPRKVGKALAARARAQAARRADLLHRRDQRPDRRARPGARCARAAWAATSGSARRPRTTARTSSSSTWARSTTTRRSTPTAAATSSRASPTATRRR